MSASDPTTRMQQLRESAQKLLAADHFVALGLLRTASADDVQKAFVQAARQWHPDRLPQGMEEVRSLFAQVFARLEAARATPSDSTRRARYVEELAKPSARAASASDLADAEATLELRKAQAMLKKNDGVAAERHLRRAVQLAPSNIEAHALLVWVQVKPETPEGRVSELVAQLDSLALRDPKSERAYFYRGMLHKRLGLMDKAVADFGRAAALDPSNVDAAREVRLHKMRQERSAAPAASADEGVGGFFRKLFKR